MNHLLCYALQNQQAGAAQTYVGLLGDSVVGYQTLAVGQVSHEEAPERLTKGLACHPVPMMLLAWLDVDRRWHGQGVGKALLKNAMQCTLQAADIRRQPRCLHPPERRGSTEILREPGLRRRGPLASQHGTHLSPGRRLPESVRTIHPPGPRLRRDLRAMHGEAMLPRMLLAV